MANVAASERRSSVTKSTQQSSSISTSSTTERRSSVTSSTTSSSTQQQQQHETTAVKKVTQQKSVETEKSGKQQKTAKKSATKKSSTEKTQKSGIDVNQTIVIVPGHQKVEFDADTNTKTVTERTTTGYQQTITTVSDEGLVKTQVKTFFNPVEIAGEETIEEEEETYEEVIETTEPTTRTTTTKTTTGASDLVEQHQRQTNTSQSSQARPTAQVVSARELPKSTVTKRQIGEEEVRYETVVSEDGKTTTVRKIVTTPGEEIEIVEYEEQEVTEPRELKVVTTTKTIPTLANIRSERSHSQSIEIVEEQQHSTSTSQRTVNKQQQQEKQSKKTKVETQFKTETNVSQDGREVETVEYEEQHITEPAAAPKTTTKTTTIPAKSTKKTTTDDTVKKSTVAQQQLAKRTEDGVAQIPGNAVVTTTLPDGQEIQVETSLSEDGKTKLLTKTVRQPEEDVEVEDYEETRTTVPRTRTTKSNNAVLSVEQRDDEEQNTIKTDKTRTRANKMASETILVDAQTDRPIGQHQQVATSLETSNVTGQATTTVDAQRGAVTSKVAASETNTKTINQEEVTVLPNETKKSTKSETRTESRTITSSQTSSGTQRQQRDSLTDTNLAAIRQKQQTIASVDKSVTAALENKTQADATNKKITKQSDVLTRTQQESTATQSDKTNQSNTTSKTSTTTSTNTQQQQKKQLEGQLKLTTSDKKITNQVVSTTTDAKTGDVTTEEIRHFDGGREHIYTTVHSDGSMKMSSKTFFDSVPLPANVGAEVQNMKQQQQQNKTSTDRSSTTKTTTTTTQQQQQKSLLEGQMQLTSADKKFTSQIVSTTTDPQTGEVTTEEVRHFDGGREHIYTTVRTDGTMKMSSKTFFDAVASSEETTTTTSTTESSEELAKKKLRNAVSSKQTVDDVNQPIPPSRKKEVKTVPSLTKSSK